MTRYSYILPVLLSYCTNTVLYIKTPHLLSSVPATFGLLYYSKFFYLWSFCLQSYSTFCSITSSVVLTSILFYLSGSTQSARITHNHFWLEMWFIFHLKNHIINMVVCYIWYSKMSDIEHVFKKRIRRHLLRLHVQNRRGHKPHISRHVMVANWAMSMGMRACQVWFGGCWLRPQAQPVFKHDKYNNVLLGAATFPLYLSGLRTGTGQCLQYFYFQSYSTYFWSHSILQSYRTLLLVPFYHRFSTFGPSIGPNNLQSI
jgi:hypothetical protein